MKVVILHQHFNTPDKGGPLRSYYLATALQDAGIQTIVVTAGHVRKQTVQFVEGIEVHTLPVPYNNRFRFWPRVYAFLRYATTAARLVSGIRGVDLCYAISVPLTVGLAARVIKLRRGIPYIFEVGDLWPDAPIQLGFVKNSLLKWFLYRFEAWVYRGAHSVVALSPMIQQTIRRKMDGKQVFLLPNMADTAFFSLEEKRPELEAKFGVSGKFVVSYIGAVGFANGLDFLIDCARATRKAGCPVHFLLCGDGALLEKLKSVRDAHALDNLSILPFQSREGVREVMNVTDAVLVCYRASPILETGSPNKYFDGLASGKLILLNFSGWIREEVESTRCGIYISANEPASIVNTIAPFLTGSERQRYQQNSRALAEEKYSRALLGATFVELIRSCADRGRSTT